MSRSVARRRSLRPAALAAALSLAVPGGLAARDISGSLTYPERIALPDEAVAAVELRDAAGRVVAEWRAPTDGAQVPLPFTVTGAPNVALTLTGAVFAGGAALRVTDPAPVEAGEGNVEIGALRLHPHLSLGFATTLRCGVRTVQLGFAGQGARLRVGRQVIELAPVPAASGARFEAPDDPGTWVWTRGAEATVSLRGEELPDCAPAAAGLMLPVTATGAGFTATIARDRLRIDRAGAPGFDGPAPAAVPVPDALGAVVGWRWEVEGMALTLQDRPGAAPGRLPQPLAAILEADGATLQGLAGAPLDLLRDGGWTVTAIRGQPVDPSLGVSMSFAEGRIMGYGGCNRYSGGLVASDTRLSVAGIAATRRACAGGRMQVESAFFAALGAMASFSIGDAGQLEIRDAAGEVILTARR